MKLLSIIFALIVAIPGDKRNRAGDGFALVELFTSEGCSSCPPADRLVGDVLKEYAGKSVYVLSYHVDYWNRLGWKDVYSKAEWSDRQRKYAALKVAQQIYTPQIIVNGADVMVGSNSVKVHASINEALADASDEKLQLKLVGGGRIAYEYIGPVKDHVLQIALVQKEASSDVQSGENSGRTLHHVNIVRSLQSLPVKNNDTISIDPGNFSVIGFVQRTKDWRVVGGSECSQQR